MACGHDDSTINIVQGLLLLLLSQMTWVYCCCILHIKLTVFVWWDCVKNDMESLGLPQKGAQFKNKWRRRIKGATG